MSGPDGNPRRWFVLLDRVPVGPLSAEQVHELLEQGRLRRNDFAHLVIDGTATDADWKLLWQFPEFNRRAPESPAAVPPPPLRIERRKAPDPLEELARRLPAELLDLKLLNLDPARSPSLPGDPPPTAVPAPSRSRQRHPHSRAVLYRALGAATAAGVLLSVVLVGIQAFRTGGGPPPTSGTIVPSRGAPSGPASFDRGTTAERVSGLPIARPGQIIPGGVPHATYSVPLQELDADGNPQPDFDTYFDTSPNAASESEDGEIAPKQVPRRSFPKTDEPTAIQLEFGRQ